MITIPLYVCWCRVILFSTVGSTIFPPVHSFFTLFSNAVSSNFVFVSFSLFFIHPQNGERTHRICHEMWMRKQQEFTTFCVSLFCVPFEIMKWIQLFLFSLVFLPPPDLLYAFVMRILKSIQTFSSAVEPSPPPPCGLCRERKCWEFIIFVSHQREIISLKQRAEFP